MRGAWQAESRFAMQDNQMLSLTTSKRSDGKISTIASVAKRENGFLTFALYQDYWKTINISEAKATEKAVSSLHAQALADLETIKADVLGFYEAKGSTPAFLIAA